ncbi:MAG: hypothetical protein ACLFN8_02420 [Candidatus Woesearchaeota archaeon]
MKASSSGEIWSLSTKSSLDSSSYTSSKSPLSYLSSSVILFN